MYKKAQYKQNGNSSDKELIDISSDDDITKVDSKKTEKDVKIPEPGCTVAEESSHVESVTVASKPEVAEPTTEPEVTAAKQETTTAKPETSTSKPETPVKSKIVCICVQFMIKILRNMEIKAPMLLPLSVILACEPSYETVTSGIYEKATKRQGKWQWTIFSLQESENCTSHGIKSYILRCRG